MEDETAAPRGTRIRGVVGVSPEKRAGPYTTYRDTTAVGAGGILILSTHMVVVLGIPWNVLIGVLYHMGF